MLRSGGVALLVLFLAACNPSSSSTTTAPSSTTSVASPTPSTSASSTPAATLPKHSGPKKDHAPGDVKVAIGGADAGAADPEEPPAPKETPASVGLPTVDFGAPGPIVVKDYPKPLSLGMRDYAKSIAWTKDGSEVVACGPMTPLGPAKGAEEHDTCFFKKRTGKTERVGIEEGPNGAFVGAAFASKLKLLQDGARTNLRFEPGANTLHPPPLASTWPYVKHVSLAITKVERKGGGEVLRIGGSVSGQEPVFPVSVTIDTKIPDLTYSADWNAIVASPDNTELAFVAHFFCAEWCNDIVITRLPHGKLASLVFNDSGFRLHQKKDFAGSRDLFLDAVWADPRAPLPPYNLACAYALLGDEANATKALKLAIAVGGDKVKERAKKDPDFKAVTAAKWFRDLTGG